MSERLRIPQLWDSSEPGPGLPVPPHAARPDELFCLISLTVSEPFGPLREWSRPARSGQARPGHSTPGRSATHQVGQSNSGRLEPEFAAAAILRLPLPFGGLEARRETGRLRGERRHPSILCVRTRARTYARTYRALLVSVETGM